MAIQKRIERLERLNSPQDALPPRPKLSQDEIDTLCIEELQRRYRLAGNDIAKCNSGVRPADPRIADLVLLYRKERPKWDTSVDRRLGRKATTFDIMRLMSHRQARELLAALQAEQARRSEGREAVADVD